VIGFVLFSSAHNYSPVQCAGTLAVHHAKDCMGWAVTGENEADRVVGSWSSSVKAETRQRTSMLHTCADRMPRSTRALFPPFCSRALFC